MTPVRILFKIVRDAPREHSERLKLSRLEKLRLELLLFGNVTVNQDYADRGAVVIADRGNRQIHVVLGVVP